MHVVYVTAGTVGIGDTMHGLALQEAARRAGFAGRVTVVCPPLGVDAITARADVVEVAMPPQALADPATASATALASTLRRLAPDVLVVGHFWAPMTWLVPALGVPAWLLVRKAPPRWLMGPPQLPFQPGRWDRILEIEPVGFVVDGRALEAWPPLVVCNPDELWSRREARAALGIDDDDPLTLVFQAGEAGECDALPAGSGRVLRPGLSGPFPIARALRAADHVVTGAGYNAFWESVWLKTRGHTTFHPFARRIDDQAWRLTLSSTMAENGADRLIAALRRG